MPNDFHLVPDGVQFENFHSNQVLLAWTGRLEKGVPMHLRGTSGQDLLFVDDAGVRISRDGVEAPTNPWLYAGMVVGWDSASTVPVGSAICDGTAGTPDLRGRFLLGVSASHTLGSAGGAETINAAHVHNGPTNSGGTGATDLAGAGDTGSGGTGNTGDSASAEGSQPSSVRSVTDTGSDQETVASDTHRHTGASHNHSGPSHIHSGPSHSHTISSHTHALTTTSALSASQSVLPPFYSLIWIRRMV